VDTPARSGAPCRPDMPPVSPGPSREEGTGAAPGASHCRDRRAWG
jgi:hypothetical protein